MPLLIKNIIKLLQNLIKLSYAQHTTNGSNKGDRNWKPLVKDNARIVHGPLSMDGVKLTMVC